MIFEDVVRSLLWIFGIKARPPTAEDGTWIFSWKGEPNEAAIAKLRGFLDQVREFLDD